MNDNFTNDLLVKYVFGQVSISEKFLIEEALDTSWEVYELYQTMVRSKRELPKVQFSPRKTTIQNILKYSSEQTALEPQF